MKTKPMYRKAAALLAACAVALGMTARMPALPAWALDNPVHTGTINLSELTAPIVLNGDDGNITLTGTLNSGSISWSGKQAFITVEAGYTGAITLNEATIDLSSIDDKYGIYSRNDESAATTVQLQLAGANTIKSQHETISLTDSNLILNGTGSLALESTKKLAVYLVADYTSAIAEAGNITLQDSATITKAKGAGYGIRTNGRLTLRGSASITNVEGDAGVEVGSLVMSDSSSIAGVTAANSTGIHVYDTLTMKDNASIREVKVLSASDYPDTSAGIRAGSLTMNDNASISDVYGGAGRYSTNTETPSITNGYGMYVEKAMTVSGDASIMNMHPGSASGSGVPVGIALCVENDCTVTAPRGRIPQPKYANGEDAKNINWTDWVPAKPTEPTTPSSPSMPYVPPVVVEPAADSGSAPGVKVELKASQLPEGVKPADVTFSAKVQELASAPAKAVETTLAAIPNLPAAKAIAVYDLDLLLKSSGDKVAFTGTVKVSIPMPAGYGSFLRVFHVANDGTMTEVPAVINGSNILLTLEHFSHYAVVDFASPAGKLPTKLTASGNSTTTVSDTEKPSEGSNAEANPKTGAMGISALALILIAGGALAARKRAK